MRVVVDTNVFVAARFKKRGASKRMMDDCIDRTIEALYVPRMKEEAVRVLTKVGASESFMERLARFYDSAVLVEDPVYLKVCEDPDDNIFVRCAVSGAARYIISSDAHLRALDGFEGVLVRSPVEFYLENNIPKRTISPGDDKIEKG